MQQVRLLSIAAVHAVAVLALAAQLLGPSAGGTCSCFVVLFAHRCGHWPSSCLAGAGHRHSYQVLPGGKQEAVTDS